MSSSNVFAGIDVGTQSVKLLVYDADSRRTLDLQTRPLDLIAHADGTREQQAGWWIDAVCACFAAVDAALRERIAAIGVSAQQHGLVPVDASGAVLAPVKLWCDTSTQAECDEIAQALGGSDSAIRRAGNPVLVGYTASKWRWLRKHHPETCAATQAVLLPHDYINYWLTGHAWMEYGDASGTGWLDVRTRRWSRAMLDATDADRDLATLLPALVGADASFPIAPAAARRLGLPHDVLVSAGGGDNMMAAIGTGNVRPGVLSLSLGTSGTLFAYSATPVVSETGQWAAFCSSTGGWLPLICTMNCTAATDQLAHALGLDVAQGDAAIARTRPGADGLTLLPLFNGERTPNLPNARGELHGIDTQNVARDTLYRAGMEGAIFLLRNGFDALTAGGMRFDAIRLTGGGSRSAAWRQMVADIFALPVDVPAQSEGAAFGAALQALWAHARAGGRADAIADIAAAHVACDPARAALPVAAHEYEAPYRRFRDHLAAAVHAHACSAASIPTGSTET